MFTIPLEFTVFVGIISSLIVSLVAKISLLMDC